MVCGAHGYLYRSGGGVPEPVRNSTCPLPPFLRRAKIAGMKSLSHISTLVHPVHPVTTTSIDPYTHPVNPPLVPSLHPSTPSPDSAQNAQTPTKPGNAGSATDQPRPDDDRLRGQQAGQLLGRVHWVQGLLP